MTKLEAEVMRGALRYWRAVKGFNADSPDKVFVHPEKVEKARTDLLEAVDRAVPAIKDWVTVSQSAKENVGFISCDGCRDSERIEGPFTMETFAVIYQKFRVKHIECGPVGQDPA